METSLPTKASQQSEVYIYKQSWGNSGLNTDREISRPVPPEMIHHDGRLG